MKMADLVFATIVGFVAIMTTVISPQSPPEKSSAEEILKEFFSSNPSNDKLLAVLEKGAKEPHKTELVKKIMVQKLSGEEASRLLVQNPPEPYAQQAWKIVESDGTLRNKCFVMNYGSPEYQDRALASLFDRTLLLEEFVFYPMQEAPQRFIKPLWNGFLKLKPGKEGFLFAAANAKGDFQEIAVLHSLNQELTASELESVLEIISEIQNRKAKEREEKLIEIMTRE